MRTVFCRGDLSDLWFKEMSCLVALFPENAGGLSIFLPLDLLIHLSPHFFFPFVSGCERQLFKKLHVLFLKLKRMCKHQLRWKVDFAPASFLLAQYFNFKIDLNMFSILKEKCYLLLLRTQNYKFCNQYSQNGRVLPEELYSYRRSLHKAIYS